MRYKGLTLIEILVVIAIIALLLTMAVPVLQKSKQQAKDLLCGNNLRQLGFAVSIYAQENATYPEGLCHDDDCHPSISAQLSTSLNISNVSDWKGYWWFCFLADTIGDDFADQNGVLWCPSRKVHSAANPPEMLQGNYGINHSICKIYPGTTSDEFSGKPLRPDHASSPSAKLLLMDSGYSLVSWKSSAPDTTIYSFQIPGRQNSYYLPEASANIQRVGDGTINEDQRDDAVNGRHSSGKINAAFVDGHVDRKKPSSVEATFDASGNLLSSSSWSP